jgi:cytochrome c-type biogenesis protein CcmH/NrfG
LVFVGSACAFLARGQYGLAQFTPSKECFMTDLMYFYGLFFLLLCLVFALGCYIRTWRMGIVLCTVIVGLYGLWGGSQEFVHVKAYRTLSNKLEAAMKDPLLSKISLLQAMDRLQDEIKDSHKGQAKLASLYADLGHYIEGSKLLEQAMKKSPDTKEYVLQWVYHQSFIHQGKLPDQARARLYELQEDPNTKLSAMNMLAMDDFFKENYAEAISYWDQVLTTDETLTAERREVLEKAIANAKAKMVGSAQSGG